MQTQAITTYRFKELPEAVQQQLIERYQESAADYDLFEFTTDTISTAAALLGFTIDTRSVKLMNGKTRQEPNIYWSGFGYQGNGLSFTGVYSYRKGWATDLEAEFPRESWAHLHGIGLNLQSIARRYFYKVSASVYRIDHYYSHANTVTLDYATFVDRHGYEHDLPESAADDLLECFRDLMRWGYAQLKTEYDYLTSEENARDYLENDDTEYLADGRPF